MQYLTATVSRVGHRSKNQDRLAILNKQDTVLLILGDGLGGRPGGEFAAQALVDNATRLFEQQPVPIQDPVGLMQQIMESTHELIVREGASQNPPINPGTTAVLCLMQAGYAWWSHVGDSRLYLFRNGEFVERTQDHSVVENMLAGGKLNQASTGGHPLRNVVTRCLGMSQNPPIVTMSQKVALKPGDVMLLCSDGFWEPLGEKTMAKYLYEGRLQESLDGMAERAENISAPDSDNVSAIALQVMSTKLRTHSIPKRKTVHPNQLRGGKA